MLYWLLQLLSCCFLGQPIFFLEALVARPLKRRPLPTHRSAMHMPKVQHRTCQICHFWSVWLRLSGCASSTSFVDCVCRVSAQPKQGRKKASGKQLYFFQNVCLNTDVSEDVHQYKMNNKVFGRVKHSQNIMSLLVHFEYPVALLA